MTVQAWIVMTVEQKDAAVELDDGGARLGPREIENVLADNVGLGTLLGKWVAPARLLNDPDYARWVPSLGALPIHVLDTDTIFLPIQDV